MAEKINERSWKILSKDEQTAISLALAYGKSTWEAGEIMGKAHFKYLEIVKRAQKFLEIFTNHFEKYHGLFPEDVFISFSFKEYLQLVILERYNISKAIKQIEDRGYIIASMRNKLITHDMKRLRESPKDSARDLYGLIMDFDRWNNFRILPPDLQEPSAFKRRNKSRDRKHLKNITSLPQFSVLKLIEKYNYTGKYKKLYLPVISEYLKESYQIISIKDDIKITSKLSELGLFIFNDRAKATDFAELVSVYFINATRDCKSGQKFWPEFRILMQETANYNQLENIHKNRTYLDKAVFDLDKRIVNKRREKVNKGEERSDDDNIFYSTSKKRP